MQQALRQRLAQQKRRRMQQEPLQVRQQRVLLRVQASLPFCHRQPEQQQR